VKPLERKTKLSLFTVAIIAALSWSLLAVVPFAAADEQELDVPTYDGQDVKLVLNRDGIAYRIRRRDVILRRFITDGSLASLEGTVVGMSQHILVVNVQDQVLNILMPGKWIVNGETLAYSDLTGEYLAVGDSITIDALRLALEKDDHAITAYLAYALEFNDVTATALLPFNIEVYATD
jgi:hypothetical protein